MKQIYKKIWKFAKPYYKKGRPMDIDHIEWMMHDALIVCAKEDIDDSLLLPLVILHDVGYAEVPKDNPFKTDLRKIHMFTGVKIAQKILEQVKYPRDKIQKISYYVSVHDKWSLGDDEIYKKDKILGVFNDLDFTWIATGKGFPASMKILNKNHKEMLEYLESNEKLSRRPFSTKTTKDLFDRYLKNQKKKNRMKLNPDFYIPL